MSSVARPMAAVFNLDGPGHYVQWGVIQISVANVVVIAVMILLFVLALLLPFPGHGGAGAPQAAGPTAPDQTMAPEQSLAADQTMAPEQKREERS
ncbi:MAG: hypothetical protein ACYCXA_01120 [Actinomycetes bacterium]